MQCRNCGYNNPPSATFCAKCIEPLKTKPRLATGQRVFIPPQERFTPKAKKRSAASTFSPNWWIVVVLVVILVLVILLYG